VFAQVGSLGLGGAQRGERGLEGFGLAAVLGAQGGQSGLGAGAFGAEFVAVLTAQRG
jgi:hypothetical protein